MKDLCFLGVGIIVEVAATMSLKLNAGQPPGPPFIAALAGYTVAYWCLSKALRTIPVGAAYSVWSGVGIAIVSSLGVLLFRQNLRPISVAGIVLIVVGVVIVGIYSVPNGS